MSENSSISWTDATWGPSYGCSRVSSGCVNCYAEQVVATLPRKFKEKNPKAFEFYSGLTRDTPTGPRWTGIIKLHEDHLLQPLRWQKPRRIFVNSLSDVFHENISTHDILLVFATMALAKHHTFQLLTKRPERMKNILSSFSKWEEFSDSLRSAVSKSSVFCLNPNYNQWYDTLQHNIAWPLPNVWIGVSVEDQKAADERIPLLMDTPASIRFLSCEPLIAPVDLTPFFAFIDRNGEPSGLRRKHPDWVIVGGESGPNFRPMHMEWARSLRDQCKEAGVAFFFKQQSAVKAGQKHYIEELDETHTVIQEFPKEGKNNESL